MSRYRVLVIDDDPLFRSLITSMLRRDYLVSVAADGAEGYYKALEHPPQLAIIDVQMPGWDGIRTLQAFRAHQVLALVPVMIMTSDASRQTVVAAIQGGANDYVIKTSLSRDDLLRKTRRLVTLDPSRVATVSLEACPIAPAPGSEVEPPRPVELPDVPDEIPKDNAAILESMMDHWE